MTEESKEPRTRTSNSRSFVWDERLSEVSSHREWVTVRVCPTYNAAHVAVISLKNGRIPTRRVDLELYEFRARTDPETRHGLIQARRKTKT